MVLTHLCFFSFFNGAGGSVTPPPTPGRSGLGGDDVPRRRSPHRGWDKDEWRRLRKEPDDALEATLKQVYAELVDDAPLAVLSQVDALVRPIALNIRQVSEPLRIDWNALTHEYERANALYRLWQDEMDLRAAIEEEDEWLLLN